MTSHIFEDLLCSDPWKLASRVARLPPNDARKVALILTFDFDILKEGEADTILKTSFPQSLNIGIEDRCTDAFLSPNPRDNFCLAV